MPDFVLRGKVNLPHSGAWPYSVSSQEVFTTETQRPQMLEPGFRISVTFVPLWYKEVTT